MISNEWIEGKCLMVGSEEFLCKSLWLSIELLKRGCDAIGARLNQDNSRVWLIFKTNETLIKALDECSEVPIKLLKKKM